jgi:hypothetical protein
MPIIVGFRNACDISCEPKRWRVAESSSDSPFTRIQKKRHLSAEFSKTPRKRSPILALPLGGEPMKEGTRRSLQQLLEQHDREYLEKLKANVSEIGDEEAFTRGFESIRNDIIQPVMAEFHDLLEEHGLKSRVSIEPRLIQSDGEIKPGKIVFECLVLTDAEIHGFPITTPTLAFISKPRLGKVLVHENSALPYFGGHIGVIEECGLKEVTADLVEKHLLAFSEKILRGTDVS